MYDDEDYDPRPKKAPTEEPPQAPFFPEQVQAFTAAYAPSSPQAEEAIVLYPHNIRDFFQSYPDYTTGADSYPEYIGALQGRGYTLSLSPDGQPCLYVIPRYADYEEI